MPEVPPHETLLSPSASLTFTRDHRDDMPAADVVDWTGAVPDVAALAFTRLPGWQVAAPPELGRALVSLGAEVKRHARTMAAATSVMQPGWQSADPGPGLRVVPVDAATLDPLALLDSQQAAYPPGHPDHEEESSLLGLLVLMLGGDIVGDLAPESSLVVDTDGTVVAGLLVSMRAGESPHGGPWVSDVWRHPSYPGLGTVLLRRAIASLHARGERALTLTVSEGNPARARYEKLGFAEAGEQLRVRVPDADVAADAAAARGFYLENARLRAHTLVDLGDGLLGVRDPGFPLSYEHNRVVSAGGVGAARLMAAADELLADAAHRHIEVLAPMGDDDIAALLTSGYEHEPVVLMARGGGLADAEVGGDPRVMEADEEDVAPFVAAQWRRDMPGFPDEVVRQLVERRIMMDTGSRATRFVAVVDGAVAGSLDMIARGPVAELEALGVDPEVREGGLGLALMNAAVAECARIGVQVTVFTAVRDDWPRLWYQRLGWSDVSDAHTFTRIVTDTAL